MSVEQSATEAPPPVAVDPVPEPVEEETNAAPVISAPSDIIKPPADLVPIVETTANYVARMGLDFEVQIRNRQAKNKRFGFLDPANPYHAFYKWTLQAAVEPNSEAAKTVQQQKEAAIARSKLKLKKEAIASSSDLALSLKQRIEQRIKLLHIPKTQMTVEPAKHLYHVPVPPRVAAIDVDIIKLTAQFTTRNGRQFMAGLTQREQKNPQFDFLKPIHPLFPYFQKLVDAYTLVIKAKKEDVEALYRKRSAIESGRKSAGEIIQEKFARLLGNAEFERKEVERDAEQEVEDEEMRTAMALIDWHDFVVLETIDFDGADDSEFLPEPHLAIEDIDKALEADEVVQTQSIVAQEGEDEIEYEEMEFSDSDEDEPDAKKQKTS